MSTSPSKNKFKNDSGVFYTKGLFYETSGGDRSSVVYTLKSEDHEGFPSLRRLYLECRDPTGYQLSTKYLGGYEHWKKLCESPFFQEHLTEWEEELEVMLRSEALSNLLQVAKDGDNKAYVETNKFLLNRGWLKQEERAAKVIEAQKVAGKSKKAGRPSDERIKEEAMRLFKTQDHVDNDFERLTKVN